jgi:hypothetical protein
MEQEVFEALAEVEQQERSTPVTFPIVARIRRLLGALIRGSVEAGQAAIEAVRSLDWKEQGKALLIEYIRGLIAKAILAAV